MLLQGLSEAACLAVCATAAVWDLRTGLIPNWLTGTGALLGLGLGSAGGIAQTGLYPGLLHGLAASASGGLFLLLFFGLFRLVGAVKMGDVKLAAAAGTLLGWSLAPRALISIVMAGGLVAIVYALGRGELGQVLRNLLRLGRGLVRSRENREAVTLHTLPYGIAIFLGTAFTVAAAHLEALSGR